MTPAPMAPPPARSDGPAATTRRARLELLVRGDDEQSFAVQEITSASAFVQSRPRRVADFELADVDSRVDGERLFILKNTRTDRFLLLSGPEKFLWDRMDGRTSLQEIATAYLLRYGSFDFDVIPALITKLQRAHLLTLAPTSRLRQALARRRGRRMVKLAESALFGLERINVSSRNVQPLFRRLYQWGGFLLFTRAAVAVCLAVVLGGIVAGVRLWPRADEVVAGFGGHALGAILAVKLAFFLTVAAHQIVHALALVHYKRRVREFGFTFLHGVVPTFYVDVTDIFMGSRRARVVTAVSGTLVHAVLGSLWLLVALGAPPGFAQGFAAASGILQMQAFLVALYPACFIEMDGYHVLVDVLGVPTLKQDALAFTGALLRGVRPRRWTREHALWIGYVALSAISVLAFVAFNVWLIVHASS